MSNQDFEKQILENTQSALKRWKGAKARLFELTVSHFTLKVLVSKVDEGLFNPNDNPHLCLYCSEPEYIQAPVFWDGFDLTVERTILSNGEQGYVVFDQRGSVKIICGSVSSTEQ